MSIGNQSIAATTTVVLAKNHQRRLLVLCNDSDETMYLAFTESAVMNQGVRLKSEDYIALFEGDPGVTEAVNAICASGSKVLAYLER